MTNEERIARYRLDRDESLRVVRDIDENGTEFWEHNASGPTRNVTAAYRSHHLDHAARLEEIAQGWER